jgi:hypothetical protein
LLVAVGSLALQRQTAAGVNFKMSSAYALLIVSSRSMQLIFPAGPLLGETGYFRARRKLEALAPMLKQLLGREERHVLVFALRISHLN